MPAGSPESTEVANQIDKEVEEIEEEMVVAEAEARRAVEREVIRQ
jgi:hypothetical protein